MALTWDLTDVANSDEICWVEATQDDPNHGIVAGEKYMSPVTNALIWATIGVDLPGITAENCGEFFARLRFNERMDGPMLIRAVDPETGKRPEGSAAFITEEEVLNHIGLRCNVSSKTRAQWLKRFTHDLDRVKFRFETKRQDIARAKLDAIA